jgi:hypothetical protein|tara:strand:- start:44 stop:247 length:204 start_codon:yes stop_codon:yes gene_type:complete
MTKDKKLEATNVASPRSRGAGQQAQDEFIRKMQTLTQGLEKEMQLEVEPNVNTIIDRLNKKDKKKFN